MSAPRGLIGVVHLRPMPGDPAYRGGGFEGVLEAAARDAEALVEGGVAAMIVENFGSVPFPKGTREQPTPPHQLALLTLAVRACRRLGVPVGVNVLRNDALGAIGLAAAAGASFVRVNVHVGAYVTDQGLIEGRAFETLRYRRSLDAGGVQIFADVRVKHAVPLAPLPLAAEVSDALGRGMADAVVLTGSATGDPVSAGALREAREAAPGATLVIGSGMSPERAALAELAEAAIVGTWLKRGGLVHEPVDPERVRRLAGALRFRAPARG